MTRDHHESTVIPTESTVTVGILSKWVHIGRGWASRLFVLRQHHLLYFKLRGESTAVMIRKLRQRYDRVAFIGRGVADLVGDYSERVANQGGQQGVGGRECGCESEGTTWRDVAHEEQQHPSNEQQQQRSRDESEDDEEERGGKEEEEGKGEEMGQEEREGKGEGEEGEEGWRREREEGRREEEVREGREGSMDENEEDVARVPMRVLPSRLRKEILGIDEKQGSADDRVTIDERRSFSPARVYGEGYHASGEAAAAAAAAAAAEGRDDEDPILETRREDEREMLPVSQHDPHSDPRHRLDSPRQHLHSPRQHLHSPPYHHHHRHHQHHHHRLKLRAPSVLRTSPLTPRALSATVSKLLSSSPRLSPLESCGGARGVGLAVETEEPQGVVELETISSLCPSSTDPTKFYLATSARTLILCADSATDRSLWLEVIEAAARSSPSMSGGSATAAGVDAATTTVATAPAVATAAAVSPAFSAPTSPAAATATAPISPSVASPAPMPPAPAAATPTPAAADVTSHTDDVINGGGDDVGIESTAVHISFQLMIDCLKAADVSNDVIVRCEHVVRQQLARGLLGERRAKEQLITRMQQLEVEKAILESELMRMQLQRRREGRMGAWKDEEEIEEEGEGEGEGEEEDGGEEEGEEEGDEERFFEAAEKLVGEPERLADVGFSYPYVPRRTHLPLPDKQNRPGTLAGGLWAALRECVGRDLSRVCLPVQLNEPIGLLHKCAEEMEHSWLLDRAAEYGRRGDQLMRALHVAAFAMSGYANTSGRLHKPFNPLLGETYEADYRDKGFKLLAEKVLNHPPTVAAHCWGSGWQLFGDSTLKVRFWGPSLHLVPSGEAAIGEAKQGEKSGGCEERGESQESVKRRSRKEGRRSGRSGRSERGGGERYDWSKVTTGIYNIIVGKLQVEHFGTMHIRGSRGLSVRLHFKEPSLFDRSKHQVHGHVQNEQGEKLAFLHGRWDQHLGFTISHHSMQSHSGIAAGLGSKSHAQLTQQQQRQVQVQEQQQAQQQQQQQQEEEKEEEEARGAREGRKHLGEVTSGPDVGGSSVAVLHGRAGAERDAPFPPATHPVQPRVQPGVQPHVHPATRLAAQSLWHKPAASAHHHQQQQQHGNKYGFTPFCITLNEITPDIAPFLPPTDSRFRPDQRALEEGDEARANEEKRRLEGKQRKARQVQASGWEPRWFQQKAAGGTWTYKGGYWERRAAKDWHDIPNIFADDENIGGGAGGELVLENLQNATQTGG
ncbi:hypothetical protein CLOM_g543 [Closterium sp. NIES-68]|nr:hypothetical protein CLOM_g543 [Closterium sp. NIES-68]